MPRSNRHFIPNIPFHVVQRGNNHSICFFNYNDYVAYLAMLKKSAAEQGCKVHALILMTNHVHLLVTPQDKHSISKMMQCLGTNYVLYINRTYGRSGTLWEGRFKAVLVDSERYFFAVSRYIELNPVRANMVNTPADYRWSSFHHNALGIDSSLITPHPLYTNLAMDQEQRLAAYRDLFCEALSDEDILMIRQSTNRGQPIGNESFVAGIEHQFKTKLAKLKHGGDRKSFGFNAR
ncbi:MAG: transposase [Algicola sp.]|nr:transposase [Algicola sp.]